MRRDHLAGWGRTAHRRAVNFPDQGVEPSLQPSMVCHLHEIARVPLSVPPPGEDWHSVTNSRIIWGRNVC